MSSAELTLFEALMEHADSFLGATSQSANQRRAQAALALAHASRQVRELMASAVAAGTPLAVELRRVRGGCLSTSCYRALPNPLGLLVVGGSQFETGDEITVVIQRAGRTDLRRSASWPFDLVTAEWLTRPGDDAEQRSVTDEEAM